MLKKAVFALLAVFVLAGCGSSAEEADAETAEQTAETEEVSYVDYETEFGLSYQLPDYWFHSIESTDTEVYDYRNSVLDLDGSMVITYISADELEDTDLDGLADMMAESIESAGSVEKDAFSAANVSGVALYATDVDANYGTADIDMYFIECGDGIAAVSFNRLVTSDYDDEFLDILNSMKTE